MSTTTAIKERPILFSGPMVRAILEGRKTQTRRIIKPQPVEKDGWFSREGYTAGSEKALREGMPFFGGCPYGSSGERIWVREAFQHNLNSRERYRYRADSHAGLEKRVGDGRWTPSIHMPRVASRINLEITGVRIERLNDISEADAVAEGIEPVRNIWKLYGQQMPGFADATGQPRKSYASLWESINGPGSWAANPWVWVVEFKVL
jgi:hypothetical protein